MNLFNFLDAEENFFALGLLGCGFPRQFAGIGMADALRQTYVWKTLSQLEAELETHIDFISVKPDPFGIPVWKAVCPTCGHGNIAVNTYTRRVSCDSCGLTGTCNELWRVDDTF